MACIKCFLIEDTGKEKDGLSLYRRTDTGEEMTINKAPVGAIWRVPWFENVKQYCGTDGRSYVCKTPRGEWMIDGRANNCGRPDDDVHKCWCRHGEAPDFTVDKVGDSCIAGSGSILIGDFHGFLINGELVSC